MAKSSKKFDFKKIAMNAVILGGTGAVAQVVSHALNLQNPDYLDYGYIAAGIILPEIVKNETVGQMGDALLAVGAYRLAESKKLHNYFGVKGLPSVPGTNSIGAGWRPGSVRQVYAQPVPEKKTTGTVN